MKRNSKIVISLALIIVAAASFLAGMHIQEQKHTDSRQQRCHTLILFAIDKVENNDLSDADMMESLVSNVYAAYELCDHSIVSAQLHELWNTLIFEGEIYIGKEDALATQLRSLLELLQEQEQ